MRVTLEDDILRVYRDDLPQYKSGGGNVRNSYFWALKSIACHAQRNKDWEFDAQVWVALSRMLLAFAQSGYLGTSETSLEFPADVEIPEFLRSVSTWQQGKLI